MKLFSKLGLVSCAGVLAMACSGGTGGTALGALSGDAVQGETKDKADEGKSPVLAVCTEGQVAMMARVFNEGEVRIAKLAVELSSNEEVLTFARKLIVDHEAANQALGQLIEKNGIVEASNDFTELMSREVDHVIELLREVDKAQFDRFFLANQIMLHVKALGAAREILIPSVKNEALKSALEGWVATIGEHQARAIELQTAIAGSCGAMVEKGSEEGSKEEGSGQTIPEKPGAKAEAEEEPTAEKGAEGKPAGETPEKPEMGGTDVGQETPEQGTPEKPDVGQETPEQGTPEQGTPEQGTPEQGTPEQGTPEQGTPEQGTPEQGTPEQGTPEQGTPEQGTPEQGTPEQGTPEQGTPEQGTPEQGVAEESGQQAPEQGTPEKAEEEAPEQGEEDDKK